MCVSVYGSVHYMCVYVLCVLQCLAQVYLLLVILVWFFVASYVIIRENHLVSSCNVFRASDYPSS